MVEHEGALMKVARELWDKWYAGLPTDLRAKLSPHDFKRLGDAFENCSRSDGVLFAIIFALNSADIRDYEGNQITEINVLQGVRRLIELAND